VHEPGLPDAGRAHHGEQVRGPLGDGPLERVLQERELLGPSDHRRVEVALVSRGPGGHGQQPERWHALLLAPQRERIDRLDVDGVFDQAIRRVPEEHLSGRRGLLQPGGDVHGVACNEALAG
jgi:hypothetical protein